MKALFISFLASDYGASVDFYKNVVGRIRASGADAKDIVVRAWSGRCCTVRDPFANLFDLIDAHQKGDA